MPRLLLPAALLAEAAFLGLLVRWGGAGREGEFVVAGLLAGGAYAGAAWAFAEADAGRRRACFWLAAVGFRLIVLTAAPADDLWRYLWEGTIQLHGVNPYVLAPDSPALAHLRDATVWPQINHRDYAAIYPPLVEKLFAGLAALGAGPLTHKLLYGAADLGVCAVVVRLAGGSHARAAWYAWNPLAVYEFAGAGHFDSLMLFALTGSAWLLIPVRGENGLPGGTCRYGQSALLLGAAVALKIVPAVLLPVWAFALGGRRTLLFLLPAATILPVSAALLYGWPGTPVFGTLREFAYVTRLNDAVWWLFESVLWTNPAQKNGIYQGTILIACLATAVIFRRDPARAMLWTLGAALLLSPALHPWYLCWILPFAVREKIIAGAWVILSVTSFAYYLLPALNSLPGVAWREPVWLRLVVFGPPALFAAVQVLTQRRQAAKPPRIVAS